MVRVQDVSHAEMNRSAQDTVELEQDPHDESASGFRRLGFVARLN